MQNDYCKVYVDSDRPKNVVLEVIRSAVGGRLEGRTTVRTGNCVIDVEDNEEFDEVKSSEPTDGFLWYRYYLDVEPLPGYDRSAYIALLSLLLEAMRRNGYSIVPACDFEAELTGDP